MEEHLAGTSMVAADRWPWGLRIHDSGGRVAGAGFLVDAQHVLTCAHVVNRALGRDKHAYEVPDADVRVDFLVAKGLRTKVARVRAVLHVRPPSVATIRHSRPET